MNYKIKSTFWFLVLLISLVGCSDSFLETGPESTIIENIPQLDIEQANKDFSELPFEIGDNDFELSVLFKEKWAFRLTVPEIADGELVPLIINMHGSALRLDINNHKREDCVLGPSLEENNLKAYILSPNSQGYLWFNGFNELQVVNLVKFAIEHLNVDPKRVVAFGISDGGFGSWFFADTHPELFSSAIAIAQVYGLIVNENGIKKTDVPVYVIHGEFDELFPFTDTESIVELSRGVGSEIEFVMAEGLGHCCACDFQPYVKDAVEWLITSVWE
ncbi:prolyl oligopeptidase family serine peptidase [Eudoraea chungangensis]|uniref:prolyl oligopeptidase family serine peptidase n=1 Tax=Eudoraea chungangensis TaxID=1481905 RepID=UPI0023EB3336|nr:prolyl oligopeptidase family serine peptidase [Eudoraea chungangensis]